VYESKVFELRKIGEAWWKLADDVENGSTNLPTAHRVAEILMRFSRVRLNEVFRRTDLPPGEPEGSAETPKE